MKKYDSQFKEALNKYDYYDQIEKVIDEKKPDCRFIIIGKLGKTREIILNETSMQALKDIIDDFGIF